MAKIHKVKSPFMCRAGQFETSRSLCIGVKVDVLKTKKEHLIQLNQTIYKIDCEDALKRAVETNSFRNDVAIVPILLVGTKVDSAVASPEPLSEVLDQKTANTPPSLEMFDMEALRVKLEKDKNIH